MPNPWISDATAVTVEHQSMPVQDAEPVTVDAKRLAEAQAEQEVRVFRPAPLPNTPRFELNIQAFVYAIDQRSVDWDPLPAFIADPSPEYLAIVQRAAE